MQLLEERFAAHLDALAQHIQQSETLAQYLEEEDEELYKALTAAYEPAISEAHHMVSVEAPLQLEAFEKRLLEPDFEGMYLPRVLGWSVLRSEINESYKYVRPNDHFKSVLYAICNSANFEQLKKRIGQTIQIGFMLSSDIWITNMVSLIENKRIRSFLLAQKLDKYRDAPERKIAYTRYANQFRNEIYFSADFPETVGEMKAGWSGLRQFLLKRVEKGVDNASLAPKIRAFITRPEFQQTDEHLEMLAIYANFFERDSEAETELKLIFNLMRRQQPRFVEKYFAFLRSMHRDALPIDATADGLVHIMIDKIGDKLTEYYSLAMEIHQKGYVHADVVDSVRAYTLSHEGLSDENECLRQTILRYFRALMSGFRVNDYGDYFEMSKHFELYMKLFDNQNFNQSIEKMSMSYVSGLLKKFTDKRSRDYQDVKKFVATNFVSNNFLTDKEVVEMFKTRRTKRKAAPAAK